MPPRNRLSVATVILVVLFGARANAGLVGFDIRVTYSGLTASQQAVFEAAAATWEFYITGYQDTVATDYVEIAAAAAAIDGAGGVLGSAGPTAVKWGPEGNFIYASEGAMSFDSADLAILESGGLLSDVVLHEMGHVLGIGTLWSSSGVGLPGFQELYVANSGQYTGAAALAAWQTEFSQPAATYVPVELGGGGGTANGHWNEVDGVSGNTGFVSNITGQDFRNELMTGWLGGSTFISTVTLGSFADLGYTLRTVPEPGSMIFAGFVTLAAAVSRIRRRDG